MVEICCGSFEDALCAYQGGAKRIELNSALYLGGLTPSTACLSLVKRNTTLEVISMVRPRGAGFCYSEAEREQIFAEAKDLLENGSDGLAFGFLKNDFSIDMEYTRKMTEVIHSYGKTAVFHRAFDCIKEYDLEMKKLILVGVDRVLTSGFHEKAMEGKAIIKELQAQYGNSIEILPGSGINATNAKELMAYTGTSQIHSSCRTYQEDQTTSMGEVSYSYGDKKNQYDCVNRELVERLIESIQ